MDGTPMVRIVGAGDDHPVIPLVEGDGEARAIIWPGIGANLRSLHRFVLNGGARTVVQCHPGEAVYHVNRGSASVEDLDGGTATDLTPGSMVHVEPATSYRFVAGDDGAEIVGGPCPADPVLYESLS